VAFFLIACHKFDAGLHQGMDLNATSMEEQPLEVTKTVTAVVITNEA
jgi:hypothetical protein